MAVPGIDSILSSTKKMLGIEEDYDVFDLDIILHINSVFSTLYQFGVGPATGFFIEDKTKTWTDFLGSDSFDLNMVKSYMFLRVRLLFDLPTTSFAIEAMKEQVKEYEWRMTHAAFMRTASSPSELPEGYSGILWSLAENGEFPSEAPVGAYGIDVLTGNVYQKV